MCAHPRRCQDKILSFWEVTKAELADAKAQLRVQAREAEDAAERAADALRVRTTPPPRAAVDTGVHSS